MLITFYISYSFKVTCTYNINRFYLQMKFFNFINQSKINNEKNT